MTEQTGIKNKLWALFIAFIMVGSILGIVFSGLGEDSSKTKSADYNNISFYKIESKWATEYNNKEIYFDYFPSEVDDIEVNVLAESLLKNSSMIITSFDLDSELITGISYIRLELSKELPKLRNDIYIGSGLLTNSDKVNLPVITCKNSTIYAPVIELSRGNKTRIYGIENCVKIEAPSNVDLTRAKDRLLYFYLGLEFD